MAITKSWKNVSLTSLICQLSDYKKTKLQTSNFNGLIFLEDVSLYHQEHI